MKDIRLELAKKNLAKAGKEWDIAREIRFEAWKKHHDAEKAFNKAKNKFNMLERKLIKIKEQ